MFGFPKWPESLGARIHLVSEKDLGKPAVTNLFQGLLLLTLHQISLNPPYESGCQRPEGVCFSPGEERDSCVRFGSTQKRFL